MKPFQDANEDDDLFANRLAEWEEMGKFQDAAMEKLSGLPQENLSLIDHEEGQMEFTKKGVWVPVKILVSWKETGVDPAENYDHGLELASSSPRRRAPSRSPLFDPPPDEQGVGLRARRLSSPRQNDDCLVHPEDTTVGPGRTPSLVETSPEGGID